MIERLLASFGINPDEIKRQAMEAAATAQATVEHFDKRLTALEAKLDIVIRALQSGKSETAEPEPDPRLLAIPSPNGPKPSTHLNGAASHE